MPSFDASALSATQIPQQHLRRLLDDPDIFCLVGVNLKVGGFESDGSLDRLEKLLDLIAGLHPYGVMAQEVTGWRAPKRNPGWDLPLSERARIVAEIAETEHEATRAHFKFIGERLGMQAVLGSPVPGQWTRLHTGVLVRESPVVGIVEAGPLPTVTGSPDPAWTEVIVDISDIPHRMGWYSAHFPARSRALQLAQVESLNSVIAQRGRLTHVELDGNAIPRSEQASPQELALRKRHLRVPRMTSDDSGLLRADRSVYGTFERAGMVDIAVLLEGRRYPEELGPSGQGGSRVDWDFADEETARAAVYHLQLDTGLTDHHVNVTFYRKSRLAAAVPPGPRD
jgi:hypothetical protein